MKIALIHALRHSPPPIEAAFARLWPQARLMNLLDDSLSADLARDGVLTDRMTERFLTLARYAADAGADGILFTCSAFGPCIEACRTRLHPLPVLKPNEAMIDEAAAIGGVVGLLASFAPTLESMPREFPAGITVRPKWAPGALAALDADDALAHDRLAAQAARDLASCDVIALAQFSLARAAEAVQRATGLPVLTTPDCAVRRMRALLEP
ncbi:aspartate/glutamate racemase family protein [Ideonella sp. DXS29W]|uniref:Aspartate/glutamate racemase family protein n=1 Tax=Ideonella lacteola TaxID=2984193 RepID=A0ABU9BIM2_9BURK